MSWPKLHLTELDLDPWNSPGGRIRGLRVFVVVRRPYVVCSSSGVSPITVFPSRSTTRASVGCGMNAPCFIGAVSVPLEQESIARSSQILLQRVAVSREEESPSPLRMMSMSDTHRGKAAVSGESSLSWKLIGHRIQHTA